MWLSNQSVSLVSFSDPTNSKLLDDIKWINKNSQRYWKLNHFLRESEFTHFLNWHRDLLKSNTLIISQSQNITRHIGSPVKLQGVSAERFEKREPHMLCSGVFISFDWLEGVVGTGVHACPPSAFLDWSCLNSGQLKCPRRACVSFIGIKCNITIQGT